MWSKRTGQWYTERLVMTVMKLSNSYPCYKVSVLTEIIMSISLTHSKNSKAKKFADAYIGIYYLAAPPLQRALPLEELSVLTKDMLINTYFYRNITVLKNKTDNLGSLSLASVYAINFLL